MKFFAILAVGALISAAQAHGQEISVGKYSGHYIGKTLSGTDRSVGIELNITSVETQSVKALAYRHAVTACKGQYPVEGTYKNNQLVLRSPEKGGPAGDCVARFRLTSDGNKLIGTFNGMKVEMAK